MQGNTQDTILWCVWNSITVKPQATASKWNSCATSGCNESYQIPLAPTLLSMDHAKTYKTSMHVVCILSCQHPWSLNGLLICHYTIDGAWCHTWWCECGTELWHKVCGWLTCIWEHAATAGIYMQTSHRKFPWIPKSLLSGATLNKTGKGKKKYNVLHL